MVSAMKKITEGKRLFEKFPSWLTTELLLLGVIEKINENYNNMNINKEEIKNIDKDKIIFGFQGYIFHNKALKSLQKSFFLYNFLLQQIELANNLNTSILKHLDLVKNSKDNIIFDDKEDNIAPSVTSLQHLFNQMSNLLVQPPLQTKKMLEKMMNVTVNDNTQDIDDDENDEITSKSVSKEKDGKSSGLNSVKKSITVYGNGKQTNSTGLGIKDRERERGSEGSEAPIRRKRPLTDALQNLPDHKDKTLQNVLSAGSGTDSTNANVQIQGQGIGQFKNKERSLKKGKASLPRCAAKDCTEDVCNIDSSYCSDLCASVSAEELLSAMLQIREKLCLEKWWKNDIDNIDKTVLLKNVMPIPIPIKDMKKIEINDIKNDNKLQLLNFDTDNEKKNIIDIPMTKKSKSETLTVFDINAFETRILNKNDGLRELTDAIQRQKFVFNADENYLNEIKFNNKNTKKTKIEENVDFSAVKKEHENEKLTIVKDDNFNGLKNVNVDTSINMSENKIANINENKNKNENENIVNSESMTTIPSTDDIINTDMISTAINDQIEIIDNITMENKDSNINENEESGTIICDGIKTDSNEIIIYGENKKEVEVEKNDVEVVIMKEEKEDDAVVDVKSNVIKDIKEEIKKERNHDNNDDNNDDNDSYNENENDITGDNTLNFLLASANESLLENENESESDKLKANKRKDISALQSMISALPSSASLLLLREADGGQNAPGPDPSPRSSHAPQVR